MDKEIFFERLFINSELAADLCRELSLTRKQYSELAMALDEERKSEITQIKRIRSLYHNKKDSEGFGFPDFNSFYKWYNRQHTHQEGKCYYCKTEEHVVAALFERKFQNHKRKKRGKYLEIERRDATQNFYNLDNCVLACYFCNNDKSDIFSEQEYLAYLKDRKSFLQNQFEGLDGSR